MLKIHFIIMKKCSSFCHKNVASCPNFKQHQKNGGFSVSCLLFVEALYRITSFLWGAIHELVNCDLHMGFAHLYPTSGT